MSDVVSDYADGVVTITLNRPDVLNALGLSMAESLQNALNELSDYQQLRCVVLRGAGKGFMAGGDLTYFKNILPEVQAGDVDQLTPIFDRVHGIIESLRRLPVPVIAAVHGAVAGFGVSLAAACDLVIANENTKFTLAYIHIGTCPDGGSTYFLPRIVGFKKATELALFGDVFDAQQGAAMGLVNKVTSDEDFQPAIDSWVSRITAGPQYAFRQTKFLLNQSLDNSFYDQVKLEGETFISCAQTSDFSEGITAFLEKRKAVFK